jgi:hypothetical protein
MGNCFPHPSRGYRQAYQSGGGEVWVAGGLYDEVRSNPSGLYCFVN